MKESLLDKLDDVLIEIVDDVESGSWSEKRDEIKQGLSERGKDCLEEFVGWFDEED